MNISIRNVISSFKLNCLIDLEKVYLLYPDSSTFDKLVFNYNVVVTRVNKPAMTFLIYKTGTIISTGAGSLSNANKSYDIFKKMMISVIEDLSLKREHRIDNIVATSDIGLEINLQKLFSELNSDQLQYEPEQFPALIYRFYSPKGTALIFSSGKVVVTGFKDVLTIKRTIKTLQEIIFFHIDNNDNEVKNEHFQHA